MCYGFWYLLSTSVDSFCFFKQKTAYEMRISDWSSDVCSSDLGQLVALLFYGDTGMASDAQLVSQPGGAPGTLTHGALEYCAAAGFDQRERLPGASHGGVDQFPGEQRMGVVRQHQQGVAEFRALGFVYGHGVNGFHAFQPAWQRIGRAVVRER